MKKAVKNEIGRRIHERRTEKGLSLQDVADEIGCGKSYLSMVETGSRPGNEVSDELLAGIERVLGFARGELTRAADWANAPAGVKRAVKEMSATQRAAAAALRAALAEAGGAGGKGKHGTLDEAHRSGRLQKIVDALDPTGAEDAGKDGARMEVIPPPSALPVQVPLINSVAAGYPRGFTDLGYPARVADEYVRTPDVLDPDAFAARVVGDSMQPEYREGDIVVFSPMREIKTGMDCFVRFEKDEEATFKRVELEVIKAILKPGPGEKARPAELWIHLIPLNAKYARKRVNREQIAGMYAAVSVTRKIG